MLQLRCDRATDNDGGVVPPAADSSATALLLAVSPPALAYWQLTDTTMRATLHEREQSFCPHADGHRRTGYLVKLYGVQKAAVSAREAERQEETPLKFLSYVGCSSA